MTALWVMLGGAVGSLARYGVGAGLGRVSVGLFPTGTFVVNIVGALLVGFVMSIAAIRGSMDSPARVAVTVGVLGGFTTFSSLSFEGVELARDGRPGLALIYMSLTLFVGLGAAALGMWAGAKL